MAKRFVDRAGRTDHMKRHFRIKICALCLPLVVARVMQSMLRLPPNTLEDSRSKCRPGLKRLASFRIYSILTLC
ncbi:uncharacterized protein K460DRAFT_365375 [Cucurbitaria berberidis CBS 394.84]|uniref:Uncharacterized protein n=1 Tax=Cucurbitaria berberidis CBS 394.84 TaxID=1168544 RepID=A0A9P4GN34_9PLEO|nr:uncharacterized protein K460DRAFT_365375 [Cucurbitaria berberidis CBS 394.84]KAF1849483.1 hypothetical protein K460DRAFT_365375 [Cucurbitaria berberidis CBS 394.84]